MIRAGVFIGVDQTGGLTRLRDAAAGAERMRNWALDQGVTPENAVLITDANGRKVEPEQICDAIQTIVDGPGVDQLLVYYAGHGVNIRYNEQWLLSEAPRKSWAAVNVSGSAELARFCGIEHVVIISDACRVAPAGIQANGVQGVDVFPSDGGGHASRPVDRYYACLLGQPAAELADPSAASHYTAIYTEALLAALRGKQPEVFAAPADDSARYIWGRPLHTWLQREIPLRVKARGLEKKVNQNPDAYIADNGSWLARHGATASTTTVTPPPPPPMLEPSSATDHLVTVRELTRMALDGDVPAVDEVLDTLRAAPTDTGPNFAHTADAVAADYGPDHFETECGIKIRGAEIAGVFARDAEVEVLTPEIVRVNNVVGPAASVVVQLSDDTGTVVPAIPGFLTGLTFDGGELVDVAHEPSANSMLWPFYRQRAEELRRLRGIAASSTLHGRFRLEGDDALGVARSMQLGKSVSPAMAVYAAYAYHDLQRPDLVTEMSSFLRGDLGISFFDVELLRGALVDRTVDASLPIVPFTPMLAQGWALLRGHRIRPGDQFTRLERTLRDSVWSLYNPDGVEELKSILSAGGVR